VISGIMVRNDVKEQKERKIQDGLKKTLDFRQLKPESTVST
jgi:hypothetical protein